MNAHAHAYNQPAQTNYTDLRQRVQALSGRPQIETWPTPTLDFEIPRGVLVHLSGHGKTEWMARFLAENTDRQSAWIENEMSVYPCAMKQHKVSLKHILFTEAGEDLLWATQQVLRSQLFSFVVVTGLMTHDRALRRLQIDAESADATVFLLNDQPYQAWPIALQLEIQRKVFALPGRTDMDIKVLKKRI